MPRWSRRTVTVSRRPGTLSVFGAAGWVAPACAWARNDGDNTEQRKAMMATMVVSFLMAAKGKGLRAKGKEQRAGLVPALLLNWGDFNIPKPEPFGNVDVSQE